MGRSGQLLGGIAPPPVTRGKGESGGATFETAETVGKRAFGLSARTGDCSAAKSGKSPLEGLQYAAAQLGLKFRF